MPELHVSHDSTFMPRATRIAAAVLVVVALVACGKKDAAPGAGAPGAGGAAPPPPAVGVIVATPGEVGLVTELPGRLEATRVSQVRARAAGILQQRLFREGSDVKAGQPLFRIDPAPLLAASQSAQASLARSEANAVQAKALADRYKADLAAAVSQDGMQQREGPLLVQSVAWSLRQSVG